MTVSAERGRRTCFTAAAWVVPLHSSSSGVDPFAFAIVSCTSSKWSVPQKECSKGVRTSRLAIRKKSKVRYYEPYPVSAQQRGCMVVAFHMCFACVVQALPCCSSDTYFFSPRSLDWLVWPIIYVLVVCCHYFPLEKEGTELEEQG